MWMMVTVPNHFPEKRLQKQMLRPRSRTCKIILCIMQAGRGRCGFPGHPGHPAATPRVQPWPCRWPRLPTGGPRPPRGPADSLRPHGEQLDVKFRGQNAAPLQKCGYHCFLATMVRTTINMFFFVFAVVTWWIKNILCNWRGNGGLSDLLDHENNGASCGGDQCMAKGCHESRWGAHASGQDRPILSRFPSQHQQRSAISHKFTRFAGSPEEWGELRGRPVHGKGVP